VRSDAQKRRVTEGPLAAQMPPPVDAGALSPGAGKKSGLLPQIGAITFARFNARRPVDIFHRIRGRPSWPARLRSRLGPSEIQRQQEVQGTALNAAEGHGGEKMALVDYAGLDNHRRQCLRVQFMVGSIG